MAWGMSKDMTPENKTIPEIWYDFLKISIEGDNDFGDPRGWHWFWSLYFLHKELPTFPSFQIVSIKKVIPENHWLHKIDCDSIDKPLGPKPAEIYELLQETFVFPAFLKAIKAIKNPEEINKIDFSQINFKELILEEPVNFLNFIFPIDTSFEHAEFPHDIEFINAKFVKNTVFNNATFFANAYFTNAVFSDTASFKNAKFHGETANFRNATFEKEANFEKVTFKEYANFKGAKFSDRTIFQQAKFELHAPRFYGAKFNNELILNRIKLPKTNRFIHNENYKVYQKTIDENQDKDICQIYKVIKEKRKSTHETYQKVIEENKSAYETLIYLMETQNKHHDKHRFFGEEMRWRQLGNKLTRERRITDSGRKTGELYFIWWKIRNCITKKRIITDSRKNTDEYYSYWQQLENNLNIIIFGLYGMLSDYGYGIGRTLAWWFGHILVGFFAIFALVFFTACWGILENLFCSFSVSFTNANPVVFAIINDGKLMECYTELNALSPITFGIIRGIQTTFGIILLFLLLTALRVRFRLGGKNANTNINATITPTSKKK